MGGSSSTSSANAAKSSTNDTASTPATPVTANTAQNSVQSQAAAFDDDPFGLTTTKTAAPAPVTSSTVKKLSLISHKLSRFTS